MMAWLLWFFLALHLFLLDGYLAGLGFLAPDLTVALCLFLALSARTSALPGLLFCAALSRSALLPGSLALHILILGLPVAVLLPLRPVFSRRSLLWQGLAAGFLAVTLPRVGGLLFRITEEGTAAPALAVSEILLAMCLTPLATYGLRSLPPLSFFAENRKSREIGSRRT